MKIKKQIFLDGYAIAAIIHVLPSRQTVVLKEFKENIFF